MKNNLGISDQLLSEALDIAIAQRTRKAATFKPGSAANSEIQGEVAQLHLAKNTLLAPEPTPLEIAARRK